MKGDCMRKFFAGIFFLAALCLACAVSMANAELYWSEAEMRGIWLVQQNDDLSKIAAATGQSLSSVMKWNPGKGNLIYPGEKIYCSPPPNLAEVVWSKVSGVFATKDSTNERFAATGERLGAAEQGLVRLDSRIGEVGAMSRAAAEAAAKQGVRIDKAEENIENLQNGIVRLREQMDRMVRATLLGSICIFFTALFVAASGYGIWIFRKSRTTFQIKDWLYRPRVDWLGRFMVLQHNKTGQPMRYRERRAARDSLKNSFNRHSELVDQEMAAGRLWVRVGKAPKGSEPILIAADT